MKKYLALCFACVMFALLPSCRTGKEADLTPTGGEMQPSAEAKVAMLNSLRKELDKVHSLVQKGNADEADRRLAPVEKLNLYNWDVTFLSLEIHQLREAIDTMRRIPGHKGPASVAEKQMLDESARRLILPETYDKTVVITPDLKPLEMPVGDMEKVYEQKVSMNLQNAGIGELVEALRTVAGLNVIADDALAEQKTLSIAVENVPLKEILGYVSRNMGIEFHLGANLVWITKAAEADPEKAAAKAGVPQLETRIIRLRHGAVPEMPNAAGGFSTRNGDDAGDGGGQQGGGGNGSKDQELQDALTTLLDSSPEGSFFRIYRDRNVLVIRDTLPNLRIAEELIKELDRPPLQVELEARFLTVSKDDLRDVGVEIKQRVQAAYRDPSLHESLREIDLSSLAGIVGTINDASSMGAGTLSLGGVIGNRAYSVLISALDKKSSTVDLSVPRVTVLNNRQAHIRRGETRWYYESYDVETLDRGDSGDAYVLVPDGDPTELELGLIFDVKVNIGNDGRTVMLGLVPQIKSFLGWEMFSTTTGSDSDSGAKLPRTHDEIIKTSVKVASGETVVLGGMLSETDNEEIRKIPLLGDIPILGNLFKYRSKTHNPNNLLIFITARVINERGEYVQYLPETTEQQAPQAAK
ncbi:MAG: hypothetical protein IJJ26_07180 [Victivallales bacterium]|nr:hypothetical protein [Victivallales bacterium]